MRRSSDQRRRAGARLRRAPAGTGLRARGLPGAGACCQHGEARAGRGTHARGAGRGAQSGRAGLAWPPGGCRGRGRTARAAGWCPGHRRFCERRKRQRRRPFGCRRSGCRGGVHSGEHGSWHVGDSSDPDFGGCEPEAQRERQLVAWVHDFARPVPGTRAVASVERRPGDVQPPPRGGHVCLRGNVQVRVRRRDVYVCSKCELPGRAGRQRVCPADCRRTVSARTRRRGVRVHRRAGRAALRPAGSAPARERRAARRGSELPAGDGRPWIPVRSGRPVDRATRPRSLFAVHSASSARRG